MAMFEGARPSWPTSQATIPSTDRPGQACLPFRDRLAFLKDEQTETRTAVADFAREHPTSFEVPRFSIERVQPSGEPWQSESVTCSIGSHPSNSIVLQDRTVSRFHCEIKADEKGIHLTDLESRNGTLLDGVRVTGAWLKEGSSIQVGQSTLRFHVAPERAVIPISAAESFGSLIGRSVSMRTVFAMLERCAATESTILLEGETGTGKEATAEAIHELGARADGPFVVVDCGAIPGNLLESELFGHEKGSFTGAVMQRIGAFEAANGGTVFLDELGELPPELQPKLLRVLEQRTIRRLGSTQRIPVDVRVIAATNRRLRQEVNEGRFRSDLYYRLAVIKVVLPPLRERQGDIPLLSEAFLDHFGAAGEARERLLAPSFLRRLEQAAWPGNVRELRNHLERCLVLEQPLPLNQATGSAAQPEAVTVDPSLSYTEARQRALAAFERSYLPALVEYHDGNVSKAARAAGIDRAYLHRLLRRHGFR